MGSKNKKGVAPTGADQLAVNKITQDGNAGLTYPKPEQYTQSPTTGIVANPVSGCTNLRANALGVGNSLAWSDISQFPAAALANSVQCKDAFLLTLGGCTDEGCTSGQRNAAGRSAIEKLTFANLNGAATVTVELHTGVDTETGSTTPYCIGPSVGYLTPYYIGSNWASEAATDETADGALSGGDLAVTGPGDAPLAGLADTNQYVPAKFDGSLGGAYLYQTLPAPTKAGGGALDSNTDYSAGEAGVLSQGLNPNTLAKNKPETSVKDGVNSGARQNFAYLSSEITRVATSAPTPIGQALEPADGTADLPYLPARLSPDEIQFAPIMAGANGKNMGGEDSFACSNGGDASGADTTLSGKTGNAAAVNGSGGAIKNQLEGLAFWKIIAGQMAVAKPANVPKGTAGNDLTLPKVHENCAANIEAMLTFNTAAVVKNTGSTTIPSHSSVEGNKPNAISFPTWNVAIGSKPTGQDFNYYVVPNGFCYVNQCLTTYLNSVTQDKGAGFGKLIKEPNMGAPTAGNTCGLANGACASLAQFRLDNRAPLSYTCSKLGAEGSTEIPEECGTSRWTVAPIGANQDQVVFAAGTDYTKPVGMSDDGAPANADFLGSDIDGVQWYKSSSQESAALSSWNGQEWPAPSNADGSPVV